VKKIAIHGLPRSGTTWLGCILDSNPNIKYAYQPLFSYALKGFLNPESDSGQIQNFFDKLAQTKDPFINQQQAKESELVPDFHKNSPPEAVVYKEVRYHHILSNLFAQDPKVFGIFIIRNPIDVLNSWINAPKEFDPTWDILKEWQFAPSKNDGKEEEFYGFEKWLEATKIFLALQEKYPHRVFCISYEALKERPAETTRDLFAKLGLDFNPQTEHFLQESQSLTNPSAYSVYRKNSRPHKKVKIPRSIIAEIQKRINTDESIRNLNY
jgi:hypothetical protein